MNVSIKVGGIYTVCLSGRLHEVEVVEFIKKHKFYRLRYLDGMNSDSLYFRDELQSFLNKYSVEKEER